MENQDDLQVTKGDNELQPVQNQTNDGQQPIQEQLPEQQGQETNPTTGGTPGKAVASLVLGIVAIIFCWLGYLALIGLVAGIVGIVLGISARKETPCGMATAGLVLSIIGVILGAIIFLACVACLGTLSSYSMMEQLNH